MMSRKMTAAAVLAAVCGSASGQVTIDGQVDVNEQGLYQTIWVNDTPTGFGDNVPGAPCTEDVSDAVNVTTGFEAFIPMAQLGTIVGDVRICTFINGSGHDFISNQVLGGVGLGAGNIGEPRLTKFADPGGGDLTGIPGEQFFVVNNTSTMAPTVDGTLDSAIYGAAEVLQTTGTGFGDSDDASDVSASGSELNGGYAVMVSGSANPAEDGLYIMLTGNLETNFNKLEVFIDRDGDANGQNVLRGDNPDVDFDGLNRMGDDGSGNGLQFDDGFAPDYYVQFTNGNTGAMIEMFASYAELLNEGGGLAEELGAGVPGVAGPVISADPDDMNVGEFAEGVTVAMNNANTMGVGPGCFEPPLPDPDFAIGSELDQVLAYIDMSEGSMGTLNLLAAGNLQTNFNKVLFFFDADSADGQNVLRGPTSLPPNVDLDFNKLNRLGFNDDPGDDPMNPVVTGPGLTFDSGFSPDYFLSVTNGNLPVAMFVNVAVLRDGGPLVVTPPGINVDYGGFDGGAKSDAGSNPVLFDGDSTDGTFDLGQITDPTVGGNLFTNYGPRSTTQNILDFGIPVVPPAPGLLQVAIDNSNIAGVTSTSAAGAGLVTTGIEMSVDLEELGWDGTSDIRLTAFVINDGHDIVSNQITGGGIPDDGMGNPINLGEPRVLDLGMVSGDQFINLSNPVMITDCNSNGVDDAADISGGTSADVNADGIPDECSEGRNRLCGDVNANGSIEPSDFTTWLGFFNNPGAPLAYRGDTSNDGTLAPNDFTTWLGFFNNPASDPADCLD